MGSNYATIYIKTVLVLMVLLCFILQIGDENKLKGVSFNFVNFTILRLCNITCARERRRMR